MVCLRPLILLFSKKSVIESDFYIYDSLGLVAVSDTSVSSLHTVVSLRNVPEVSRRNGIFFESYTVRDCIDNFVNVYCDVVLR